jgi:metal-responsive CopG/Arc/MetJ family transcriptional regulator
MYPMLTYAVTMSDTKNPVYLDADLLARLEGLADEAGVDRDAYVQDALRRYLAGRDLVALQREVSTRSGVAFDDALDLVYSERDAARAESASGETAGPQPR